MKHRKTIRKLEDSANGHIVLVLDKTRVLARHTYPTYGKAMWGAKDLEEQYPGMEVEYRDVRSFREDDYGDH